MLLLIKYKAPRAGLEPATTRLTAECSTIELSRIAINLLRKLIAEELLRNSSRWLYGNFLPASQINHTADLFCM